MKADSLETLREIIAKNDLIAISAHENPDGDAIGSCLALAMSLKQMGKRPIVLLEEYGQKYDCIAGKELIANYSEGYDSINPQLFICLDCGSVARMGRPAEEVFKRSEVSIVIDHHRNNEHFGSFNYVDEHNSSASEIVFDLMDGHMPMDEDIAAALYVGFIYDTGAFRHSSTSPKTMEKAGRLMEYGIPFTRLYRRFFDNRSFSELKLLGKAFDKANMLFDNKFIYTIITKDEILACNGSSRDLDSVVNFIRSVDGTGIACFIYEKSPGVVKASFRCGSAYDVCTLTQKFGGGGHTKAAGCTINASADDALNMIIKEVEKIL